MSLPPFNENGDLPPGVYRVTIVEVIDRFRGHTESRRKCTRNLQHVFQLAVSTKRLAKFVLFGSYVTDKEVPNAIDVILIMEEDFRPQDVAVEARGLFDHAVAQERYGASIFWIKASILLGGSIEDFVRHWQIKRDETQRESSRCCYDQ